MACPLPIYTRFNAPIFAALRRVRGAAEAAPDSLAFASLQGDGELVGISHYRPSGDDTAAADPTAVWNRGPIRKYTRREFSGRVEVTTGTIATGCALGDTATGGLRDDYTGAYVIGAAGELAYAVRSFRSAGIDGVWSAPFDENVFTLSGGFINLVTACPAYGVGPWSPVAEYFTSTARILSGCGCTSPNEGVSVAKTIATAREDLTTPDTEWAALERAGGAVAGSATETLPGSYALTEPQNIFPLAFTDCRSVRVTAGFSRLLVGHTYTLRAWYRLRSLVDGIDDTTRSADVAYTPAASSVSIPHDLPVFEGYAVSLNALRLLP